MNALVVHAITRARLERFAANPSHAVLLTGTTGAGKTTLAEWLTTTILGLEPGRLSSHAYYTKISPDEKGTISIDAIRELSKFLQLKTIGTTPMRRAALIESASGMTTEAQNAFLKLLEEPPSDTLLVLTAESSRHLLPTILSRLQSIAIQVPEESAIKTFFANLGKNDQAITQAYFLSGGLPGLTHALLEEQESHPLLAGVIQAKELLRQTPYERLCTVDALSKQKDTVRSLLKALQRIAQTCREQAAAKKDAARLKQWHRIHKETLKATAALEQNGNAKLTLTNLFLNLN